MDLEASSKGTLHKIYGQQPCIWVPNICQCWKDPCPKKIKFLQFFYGRPIIIVWTLLSGYKRDVLRAEIYPTLVLSLQGKWGVSQASVWKMSLGLNLPTLGCLCKEGRKSLRNILIHCSYTRENLGWNLFRL